MQIQFPSTSNIFFVCEKKRALSLTATIMGVFLLVVVSSGSKTKMALFQGIVGYALFGFGLLLCLIGLKLGKSIQKRAMIEDVTPVPTKKELILTWIGALDRPAYLPSYHVNRKVIQEDSDMHSLMEELLVLVFSYLDPITLVNGVGLTCIKFHSVLQDQHFKRKIDIFQLANKLLHPLSHQPSPFDHYFTSLICVKVAKYQLSTNLIVEAYHLAGRAKEMMEANKSPKRKYKLSSMLQDFELDLPFFKCDLEGLEEYLEGHYKQKISFGKLQDLKFIFFSMVAKDAFKKGNVTKGVGAIKKTENLSVDFFSGSFNFEDPNFAIHIWISHAKRLIYSNNFQKAENLLEQWPLKDASFGSPFLEKSFNKYVLISLWIDLAVQMFPVNSEESNDIFHEMGDLVFHHRGDWAKLIGNLLKVRLGVKLAYAQARIGNMEECKQMLIEAFDLWDEKNKLTNDIFSILAKISLLIDPENTLSISNLIEIVADDKRSQIKILLKSLNVKSHSTLKEE